MKCIVMFSYPKLEFDNYEMSVEYHIKNKDSNMFLNVRDTLPLDSVGISHLVINKRKYDYEWYTTLVDKGSLIKEEIIKKYFIGNQIKTKKEINYFIAKTSKKNVLDEAVFPFVAGEVLQINPDSKELNKNKV